MSGKNESLKRKDLSTTDLLALERTKLANERTLLAYIRTALAALAAAASLIQFFENPIFRITGYLIVPIGFIILATGIYSYYRSKKSNQNTCKT